MNKRKDFTSSELLAIHKMQKEGLTKGIAEWLGGKYPSAEEALYARRILSTNETYYQDGKEEDRTFRGVWCHLDILDSASRKVKQDIKEERFGKDKDKKWIEAWYANKLLDRGFKQAYNNIEGFGGAENLFYAVELLDRYESFCLKILGDVFVDLVDKPSKSKKYLGNGERSDFLKELYSAARLCSE